MANSYKINSISRAAEILKHLSNGVSKLTELSRRLDVNKASVHRIMKTLEGKGLVSQDPSTRRYYLGPLIQSLAENPVAVHRIVSQLALAEMERLRNICDETVILQIRLGVHRLLLEKVLSNHAIRFFPESRHTTAPIHVGAGGKVLLAGMDRIQLEGLLDRLELTKAGPNTITEKSILLSELDRIRKQGYAISFGETIEGGGGVAALISNYTCPVALIVIGPEDRIKEKLNLIVKEISFSAAQISKRILTSTGIKNGQISSDI